MMCYKDRTFCNSPHCENKCGRKLTYKDVLTAHEFGFLISAAPLCDEPEDLVKTKEEE